jgi:hypothetical protein
MINKVGTARVLDRITRITPTIYESVVDRSGSDKRSESLELHVLGIFWREPGVCHRRGVPILAWRKAAYLGLDRSRCPECMICSTALPLWSSQRYLRGRPRCQSTDLQARAAESAAWDARNAGCRVLPGST